MHAFGGDSLSYAPLLMKKYLLPTLLFILPVQLFAAPQWKNVIAAYKADAAKKPTPAPGGMVFPNIAEMLDAIFLRYPVTHILAGGTDIYIDGSDIFVIQQKDSTAKEESWNLAVTADGVYEWKAGGKTGLKIKRDDKEIIAYIWYLLDPAGVNTGLYGDYLSAPSTFDVLPGKGGVSTKWKEFRPKNPQDGFEAVYVTEKPLWYHGFRVKRPDGVSVEVINSDPEAIKDIPAVVKARMKGVKFEDSPLTLRRHLQFF